MTTLREAAQMALDAMRAVSVDEHLCNAAHHVKKDRHGIDEPCPIAKRFNDIAEALRAALAQPEPEPVAYLCENAVGHKYFRWKKPPSTYKPIALYTAPPQREFIGLTDEEYEAMAEKYVTNYFFDTLKYARAIEAKLKEKDRG